MVKFQTLYFNSNLNRPHLQALSNFVCTFGFMGNNYPLQMKRICFGKYCKLSYKTDEWIFCRFKFTSNESSYKKVVLLLAMPIYIAEKGNELQRKPL